MAAVEEGWYRDPTNVEHERYWLGTSWAKGARVASEGTPPFPGDQLAALSEASTASSSSDGLDTAAGLLTALAVLTGLGAAILGIALIAHSVPHCVANPYNGAFGVHLSDCSRKDHPFRNAGIGVLIGGLVQAAVIGVIGHLCRVVSELRAAQAGADS